MAIFKSTSKVGLIGSGMVGTSFAYSLMQQGTANELILIDADQYRAEGEMMDLNHGMAFVRPMIIRTGDYPDLAYHLQNALAAYIDAGHPSGNTVLDQEAAVNEFLKRYVICKDLFHGFDW